MVGRGVGGELKSSARLEAVDGLDEADGADLHEVLEGLSPVVELGRQEAHQVEVVHDELAARLLVALLLEPAEQLARAGTCPTRASGPSDQRTSAFPIRFTRRMREPDSSLMWHSSHIGVENERRVHQRGLGGVLGHVLVAQLEHHLEGVVSQRELDGHGVAHAGGARVDERLLGRHAHVVDVVDAQALDGGDVGRRETHDARVARLRGDLQDGGLPATPLEAVVLLHTYHSLKRRLGKSGGAIAPTDAPTACYLAEAPGAAAPSCCSG